VKIPRIRGLARFAGLLQERRLFGDVGEERRELTLVGVGVTAVGELAEAFERRAATNRFR